MWITKIYEDVRFNADGERYVARTKSTVWRKYGAKEVYVEVMRQRGRERFAREALEQAPAKKILVGLVTENFNVTESYLYQPHKGNPIAAIPRNVAMYLGMTALGWTPAQTARQFRCHESLPRGQTRVVTMRRDDDHALDAKLTRIEEELEHRLDRPVCPGPRTAGDAGQLAKGLVGADG